MTDRSYRVIYDTRAAKEMSKLDRPVARRIHRAVTALAEEPRPPGCRALVGYPGFWRLRIGDYRIVCSIDDGTVVVLVLRVAHRSSV